MQREPTYWRIFQPLLYLLRNTRHVFHTNGVVDTPMMIWNEAIFSCLLPKSPSPLAVNGRFIIIQNLILLYYVTCDNCSLTSNDSMQATLAKRFPNYLLIRVQSGGIVSSMIRI